jgi:hypothetical protein
MNAGAVRGVALRLCCCLVLSAACATGGGSSATRRSGNNDTQITLEEIESAHQPTLFDVVRALRPMWLRVAPTAITNDQSSGIAVYVDEQRAGGLDALRQLPSTAALKIRFYASSEAQSRFGIVNAHGVIQVVSPRGSREH